MKKIAITLCILGTLGLTSSAFASFQSDESASIPHMRAEGFSESATQVADTVKQIHSFGEAEAYYDLDPVGDSTDERGKWYTVVKTWLDPAQDDKMFGRHEINFTNEWFDTLTGDPLSYSRAKKQEEVTSEKVDEDVNVQDAAPAEEIENL